MPIGWAVVVVVQWLAIVFLAAVVLGVLRRVTPHLEHAAERPVPRADRQGPALGSQLPSFTARETSGDLVSAGLLRGRPRVLLFLSADCSPCLNLATELGSSDRYRELSGSLVAVTGPAGAGVLPLPAWLRVLTMPDAECSRVLEVRGRPFAIAVDADGVITDKRMVNTVAQLTQVGAPVSRPAGAVTIPP
jgi:hypothetical protein